MITGLTCPKVNITVQTFFS